MTADVLALYLHVEGVADELRLAAGLMTQHRSAKALGRSLVAKWGALVEAVFQRYRLASDCDGLAALRILDFTIV